MSEISIIGSHTTYTAFWKAIDRSLGEAMVKKDFNLNPIKKFFVNYCLKEEVYNNLTNEALTTSLHRFFAPVFSVSVMTFPIVSKISAANPQGGGRNIVNIPYSIFCTEIF